MRILYVTSYPLEYDSSSNVRNISLIKGMLKNGHSVSTFSPYPTDTKYFSGHLLDLPFEQRFWIGSQTISEKKESESNKPSRIKTLIVRWYSKFSIYDRRSWLKKHIKENTVDAVFDAIVSSSDPKSAHLFAERLINIRPSICKKWIQYWGDPMTNDITSKSLVPEFVIRREERRILQEADKIVYVSPLTSLLAKKTHPALAERIEFYPVPFRADNKKKEFSYNNRMVSYIGDYSSTVRNMEPLITALKEMDIPAAVIGNSDIKVTPTNNLLVKDRLIGKELEEITNNTGVYVCVCNKCGTQIPGKIYHNVNTGKPILIILDGEYKEQLKDYFASFNRYYMCLNDKDEIVKTLREILNDYKQFDIPQQLLPEVIAKGFLNM